MLVTVVYCSNTNAIMCVLLDFYKNSETTCSNNTFQNRIFEC